MPLYQCNYAMRTGGVEELKTCLVKVVEVVELWGVSKDEDVRYIPVLSTLPSLYMHDCRRSITSVGKGSTVINQMEIDGSSLGYPKRLFRIVVFI
jgi:hypothetical protein